MLDEKIEEKLLKKEEKAVFSLRALYRKYGYLPFKMSKFEEYDFYMRNRDFLASDRIITFNDTGGELLALKPDVTLSIIKNAEAEAGCKQKVYYNEYVYRVSGRTHQYKEILQTGIECIGDIDIYDVYETVLLAAKSLKLMNENFILDISHLGILTAFLDEIGCKDHFLRELVHCIGEKNSHDIERICLAHNVPQKTIEKLKNLVGIYGKMENVLRALEPLCDSEASVSALSELRALFWLLKNSGFEDRIRFDFSVVNDMNYYNGIVFRGFLDGICEGILSGGQYDNLMQRMGRKSGAIGFAIYLDLLEGLESRTHEFDVDVLVLYDAKTNVESMAETISSLTAGGKNVSAQRCVPEKLRYRVLLDLREGGNHD